MKCQAEAPTKFASRYLQQLCKHWSHKFPVEFTPTRGQIDLPLGRCALEASENGLLVTLDGAPGEVSLEKFQQVVVRHLGRFGFREELVFDWRATDGPAPREGAGGAAPTD